MALKNDWEGFKGSKTGKYVMYAIYIIIIIAIVLVVVRIVKALGQTTNTIGDLATDAAISKAAGVDVARVSYIRTTAQNLYDKSTYGYLDRIMHGHYNTDNFVSAVNNMVGANEVKLLNQFYTQAGGDSLKDVFSWYNGFGLDPSNRVNTDNWATIQSL